MAPILIFLCGHWILAIFTQTFFLHRYASHAQFRMSKRWETFFHGLTWVVQGASYLEPRAYGILHRMHHAHSDTARDPHSPVQNTNVFTMMWRTKKVYAALRGGAMPQSPSDAKYAEGYFPRHWFFDGPLGSSWGTSIAWGTLYTLFYIKFATSPWQFGLLFFHYFMGPVHGAIVNWCGHKYGYRNFGSDDHSRNTLPFDFVTLGELFQNNHHKFGMSPNFAVRWFEVDPCYQVMRVLDSVGAIDMTGAQQPRWTSASANAPRGLPRPQDAE